MSCTAVKYWPISLCYIMQEQLNATLSSLTRPGRATEKDGWKCETKFGPVCAPVWSFLGFSTSVRVYVGPTGEVRKHLVLSISHRVGLQPSRTLTTWVYYEQLAELNNSRRSAWRVQMPISKKRMPDKKVNILNRDFVIPKRFLC